MAPVQEARDLAGGHPVPVGERVEPHEGAVVVPDEVPLHRAADRVGAVKDDEALALLGRRFHRVGHRPDVGVVAGPDVLDVEDQDVEPLQHGRGGPPGRPVEAVDGYRAVGVRDLDEVLLRGVEAVLGREERRERHPRQAGHNLPRVPKRAVHRRRVRNETDAESAEQLTRSRQPVQSGLHRARVHWRKTTQSGPRRFTRAGAARRGGSGGVRHPYIAGNESCTASVGTEPAGHSDSRRGATRGHLRKAAPTSTARFAWCGEIATRGDRQSSVRGIGPRRPYSSLKKNSISA